MTPDDSCFYCEPDAILTHRAKTERFIGRLPRHIAYPLILVVSIVSWSCVGIAAAWAARLFSS